MSEGNNVKIITPGGTHDRGKPLAASAAAGAWILEAPTPLKDEPFGFTNFFKTQSGEVFTSRKPHKRSGAARRAARKQRLLAAENSIYGSEYNHISHHLRRKERDFAYPFAVPNYKPAVPRTKNRSMGDISRVEKDSKTYVQDSFEEKYTNTSNKELMGLRNFYKMQVSPGKRENKRTDAARHISGEYQPLAIETNSITCVATQRCISEDIQFSKSHDYPYNAPVSSGTKRRSGESTRSCNYAIVDAGRPAGIMTAEQQNLLEKAFSDALMNLILTSTSDKSIFKIDMGRFENGVFRLAINSKEDFGAIQLLVESLPELWNNSTLRLVPSEYSPKLFKAHVFIRGRLTAIASESILKMLAKQNIELKTDLWEVFHRESTRQGDVIAFGIDEDSYSFLESVSGKAHLLFSIVHFKLGQRHFATEPPEGCSTNEIVTDITSVVDQATSPLGKIYVDEPWSTQSTMTWKRRCQLSPPIAGSSGHFGDTDATTSEETNYQDELLFHRRSSVPNNSS
ncbi:uncharacterized protein LOC101456505 isoform X1 [Ceratitis capitata]|uniref:uncharacterized protein LOC101456505 isoform X1 n=1 Tax=Ceratitis capitata TaxID=7213 RepID=UPI0006188293|nr:uncharacterized protein LOC101456505 isoform X1 [Ceratitis capitata]XP_012155836.1 uncharacterized protein LOC101456505 isoform X1 [Ceratitis capitata]